MKSLKVLILLLLVLPVVLNAQEHRKQKELGITSQNLTLENFGITYKFGKPAAMWRINALTIRGLSDEFGFSEFSLKREKTNQSITIGIGREYRKKINDDFEFRYGLDVSFGYSKFKSEQSNEDFSDQNRIIEQDAFSPKVNMIVGINYVFKNNIVIGLEVLPGFQYRYSTATRINNTEEEKQESNVFQFGIGNDIGMLSLAYRF